MRDVLAYLEAWREANEQIAVATVVETWGSAPRPAGSKMAATLSGGVAGSVSAGCVEGAVIDEGHEVLRTGKPRLLTYGVADDEAWEVGLACGGTIRVFVEPFSALSRVYDLIKANLEARIPMAVVSVIQGPEELLNHKLVVLADGTTQGDLEVPLHHAAVVQEAQALLARGTGGTFQPQEDLALFIEVYALPPRLIIVGAVHIAEVLVPMANLVGFDTVVVDPRAAFATRERFPSAGQLLKEWPQKALGAMLLDHSAYVVVLTHDPKLDDPALSIALRSEARYIGALGSERTNARRLERLRAEGISEEQIGQLHAPIGLPLGGRTTGEIAVSILAEITQVKNRRLV